jgi:hypothetical protein
MLSKALNPASVEAEKMEILGLSDWYNLRIAPSDIMRKKLTKITGPA